MRLLARHQRRVLRVARPEAEEDVVRVLLLAPPGAGKGTQGVRIARYFGIEHIAMGDILRDHVERESGIGRAVSGSMARGELVPDAVVIDMLRKPIDAAMSSGGGYVLDGFPRTVPQAKSARASGESLGTAAQVALFLHVEEEELVRRLLARAETEGRADDNEPTIRNRLQVYAEATAPVVDWYRERGLLVQIDGAASVDDVSLQVLTALEVLRPIVDHVPEAAQLPVDLSRATG